MVPESAQRLAGKRVMITGTGRGQGAAAQQLFCEHGASVVGCDVVAGAAEEFAATLREQELPAWGSTVDLGSPEAARSWVEEGVDRLGGLDVLYNNAGAPKFAAFEAMTLEDWRYTVANELDLLFYVTQPAWSHLVDGGGSVINTASVSATLGSETLGGAAHSAAKAGVVGLTKQLAGEGARHRVRANAILPGFVETPGALEALSAEMQRETREAHPLKRGAKPEEIARLALYLASDESSFMTGAELYLDGGLAAVQ